MPPAGALATERIWAPVPGLSYETRHVLATSRATYELTLLQRRDDASWKLWLPYSMAIRWPAAVVRQALTYGKGQSPHDHISSWSNRPRTDCTPLY
jgi:hypothetical protein